MEISTQYLLVQFGSVGVFEGKAAADHSIEDDSGTPDVDHDGLIRVLGLDHFRSRIAGRSTGSLESFLNLIGVGKPKVHNPDGFIEIHQQVFKF